MLEPSPRCVDDDPETIAQAQDAGASVAQGKQQIIDSGLFEGVVGG